MIDGQKGADDFSAFTRADTPKQISVSYLVQFSGGRGSWAAAKRCVERYGAERVSLLFADTLVEDADLYRFLVEGAANIRGLDLGCVADLAAQSLALPPVRKETISERKIAIGKIRDAAAERLPWLTWICDGRTPWEVFKAERFIGNSRVDPCSKILKRQLCDDWRAANTDPVRTIAVLGIDWTESHRHENAVPRFAPWQVIAPLCDAPYRMKAQTDGELGDAGIRVPRLYENFHHNNCGGACSKAGQAQWARLLEVDRDLYLYNEEEEEDMRSFLGKDVSILKDRRGGTVKRLTLRQFRERLEGSDSSAKLFDQHEWGGCGCFSD